MPFEVWEHALSGEQYLVVVTSGDVRAAAGPLRTSRPVDVFLGSSRLPELNREVLLDMQQCPQHYQRVSRGSTDAADGRHPASPDEEKHGPAHPLSSVITGSIGSTSIE
jgi:hypothetical protein